MTSEINNTKFWTVVKDILCPFLPKERRDLPLSCRNITVPVEPLTMLSFSKMIANPQQDVDFWAAPKADGEHLLLAFDPLDRNPETGSVRFHILSESIDPIVPIPDLMTDGMIGGGGGGGLYVMEAEVVSATTKTRVLDTFLVFDMLIANGVPVVDKPLEERRRHLADTFKTFNLSTDDHKMYIKEALSRTKSKAVDRERLRASVERCFFFFTANKSIVLDGLVLTQNNVPYYEGSSCLKWKPAHLCSLDLMLVPFDEVSPNPSRFIACASVNFMLYRNTNHGKNTVPKEVLDQTKLYFPHEDEASHAPFFHPSYPFLYDVVLPEPLPRRILPAVCELALVEDPTQAGGLVWKLHRVRDDKTKANSLAICWENLWQRLHPVQLRSVLNLFNGPGSVPQKAYFQVENAKPAATDATTTDGPNFDAMLKAMQEVKKHLLAVHVGTRRTMVDLGIGRGQDVFKLMYAKVHRLVGIDNDMAAFMELTQRYLKVLSMSPRPTELELRLAYADLLTTDPRVLAHDVILPHCLNGTADFVLSNFAIHYMCGTEQSMSNLVRLITTLLFRSQDKFKGAVMLTFPCGKRVHDLLKSHNGVWKCAPYHDEADYDVNDDSTNVDADGFPHIGLTYRTCLPFTAGDLYREPLVHTAKLKKMLVAHNFTIKASDSLAALVRSNGTAATNDALTPQDWCHLEKYVYLVAELHPSRAQRMPL
eukprot:PhM_4_TR1121/c0_g1_i1/m.58479